MKYFTTLAFLLVGVQSSALPQPAPSETALGVQQPSAPAAIGRPVTQGCFSSKGSDLQLIDGVEFPTQGGCISKICYAQGYKVGGQTGGNQCFCGNKYPPNSTRVEDSKCNAPCNGYPTEACGSLDGTIYTIYNTGKSILVDFSEEATKPSNTPATSADPTSTGGGVTTVTKSSTPDPSASNGNGNGGGGGSSNTAGIAAGVVVGILAIAGIVGGVLFYLRRKRNREIEEEHRRNAAVNSFMSSGKPPGSSGGHSSNDSRLDPVLAHRRVSNGSIADNEDYSRKILRVTNA